MAKIQSGYLFRLLKVMRLQLFFFIFLSGIAFSQNRPPVYPPNVSDIDKLKQSVAAVDGKWLGFIDDPGFTIGAVAGSCSIHSQKISMRGLYAIPYLCRHFRIR